MASLFSYAESYGASSGGDISFINLLSADVTSGSDATTAPAANPIVIPASSYAYSYERAIRGHWTGSFSTITSVYFWKQSGTLPGSVKIKALKKASSPTVYSQPVATASTIAGTSGNEATATNDIPVATGTINPAYNSGSTGTPATTQCSDYIYLQLVVPSGSSSGSIGTMTYRMGWNET